MSRLFCRLTVNHGLKLSAATFLLVITSCALNTQQASGCKYNESPRPKCSTEWEADKKGKLLIVNWPDGDKSSIRPTSSNAREVLINEIHPGLLISKSKFYTFKNLSTGSTISISPKSTEGTWSSINLKSIEAEERRKAEAIQKQQAKLEAIARKEQQQREEKERWEKMYNSPVARLTVKQISNEFEANSIVAEEKYANKMVAITGVIDSVDDSMFDQSNVTVSLGVPDSYTCFAPGMCTMMPDMSFAQVSCSHNRSEKIIRQLSKNMKLEVRGVVYSESTGVRLKNCKYYKN